MKFMNNYNNKMKAIHKIAFITLITVLSAQMSFAQSKSEISVVASGIFSKLDYDTQEAYLDQARGGSFGLGYSFYFNTQWAINIGAEYESFKNNLIYSSLQLSSDAVDIDGEAFEYRYTAERYDEEQKLNVINIPLTLQFQTDGDETKFYARVGGQISLINDAEYSTSIRSLTTSGYYPQYDAELFDPQFMGFGRYNNVSQESQDLEFDTSFAAVVEAGVKREIYNLGSLYLGLFCNYGLTTLSTDTEAASLVEYNTENPTDFTANSVLQTDRAEDIRLMSYGIKLRFAIGGF